MALDQMFPTCQLHPEDIWHVMWSCPASIAVWQEGPRPVQKLALSTVEMDGFGLFSHLRNRLSEEDLLLSLMVARSIWLRRNSFVFENSFTPPQ